MVFHNFNCPAFIRYTIEKYGQGLSAIGSYSGSLEYWNSLARAIEQVPVCGMALNTNLPSAKESLAAAINAEIKFARTKEETLASIYGSRISNHTSQPGKSSQVLTNLSVSQLGVWFRLFNDCGMIQHNNQTELLKMVAAALQTTRTAHISAESLRVKYYAPELSAINIVKEHLHQMLNQLKKY